ncbi:cobalt ECF transporter T component CbiQ [Lyngbya sp. CCY1209]|uniref:cobalt ECF transporter T component CbiQ n=1 Tax=Lyngbya sp. CCY1209 TaxID=2886103 RepID=UPI002D20F441|nr:cobalt ECF transporter T component CbiQ [Lyngbya sp. CCY1209]MEB3887449.1 cobalt ECF transporter T component CbiQ [Lyngbya sp. CCY1209]
MNFRLDEYAHLDSPIHRWHPQSKLIGLLALMFAFAAVETPRLIPAMFAVAIALYLLSKLPFSFLASRLQYPGLFLLGVVALLPFFSGQTPLWTWGPVTVWREGSLAVLLIASRFLAIFTVGVVLLGSSSFLTLIKAMRSLGLSPILADMLLISYRYIFELGHQFQMMRRATVLRGFRPRQLSRRNLQVYAALAGSLLIRSYQQSEQVYKAMQLRGYGTASEADGRLRLFPDGPSAIAFGTCIGLAAGFVGFEIFT